MGDRILEASIIIIGDELLEGNVVDKNGHLAAERLRRNGVLLGGVHVIRDELQSIVGALRGELHRPRPRLVLTSGGIGSTHDDVTFAAVAASLGLPLRIAAEEVETLESELADLRSRGYDIDDEGREEAMSMIVVPEGAQVLRHSGWVCGVRVDVDGGIDAERGLTVVALPGVPSYFRTVLDDVVVPEVIAGRGEGSTTRELPHALPELALAPQLRRIAERWPAVRIGSYPGDPSIVRVTGPPDQVEGAARDVEDQLAALAAES